MDKEEWRAYRKTLIERYGELELEELERKLKESKLRSFNLAGLSFELSRFDLKEEKQWHDLRELNTKKGRQVSSAPPPLERLAARISAECRKLWSVAALCYEVRYAEDCLREIGVDDVEVMGAGTQLYAVGVEVNGARHINGLVCQSAALAVSNLITVRGSNITYQVGQDWKIVRDWKREKSSKLPPRTEWDNGFFDVT